MSASLKKTVPYAVTAVLFIVLIILWLLPGRSEPAENPQIIPPVRIRRALKGTMVRTVQVTGTVRSDNQITLVPRVPGRIDDILVTTGDRVELGQEVALIDPEGYRLSLMQAESSYSAARSTYERLSSLYRAGAASEEDYTRAKAQYDALNSQYELARLQFGYTRITSPIEGTVLAEHINRGTMAGTDTPVLTIGSVSDLTVKTPVPETYLPLFLESRENRVGRITAPSLPGIIFTAHVKSVAPYVTPGTGQFMVTLSLDETSRLTPGMLLSVDYNLETRENQYYLPLEALTDDNRLWYVNNENRAVPLAYESLFETEDFCAVPPEWKDYSFIIEGQHFLVPDQEVRILDGGVR
jgi:RND family efflux transporter MFP subunit